MDSKLEKWLRWFDTIQSDIQQLLIHRDIFWEVQKIVRSNPKIQKPTSFYHYLGQTYIAYIAIGIRRQVKIHKDSISFAGLLSEMIETPSAVSRAYYKSLYQGSNVEEMADSDFDQFAGNNSNHISPDLVRDDLEVLKFIARRIEAFADKHIAHHDIKKPRELPTFNDADECLDTFDRLAVKYYQLFHGVAMSTLMPTYQYDWMEIFRVPWLPSEHSFQDDASEA